MGHDNDAGAAQVFDPLLRSSFAGRFGLKRFAGPLTRLEVRQEKLMKPSGWKFCRGKPQPGAP